MELDLRLSYRHRLSYLSRVGKPGGVFDCSTCGDRHLLTEQTVDDDDDDDVQMLISMLI